MLESDRTLRRAQVGVRGMFRMGQVLAAIVGFAVLVALSGCGENYGPVQLSVIDGKMAVAICDDQTIDSIVIYQLPPGGNRDRDLRVLWDARGPRALEAGDIISPDQHVEAFETKAFADVFESAEGYSYQISVTLSSGGPNYSPVFRSPAGGLKDGVWLKTDGGAVSESCTY